MLTSALMILGGLVALVIGGEGVVRGATFLAGLARIPPVIIGLTVVALGTSSPELAVAVQSALAGEPDFVVGNVTAFLVLQATDHRALSLFTQAMLLFVLPLTALTIVLVTVRSIRAGRWRATWR